MSRGAWFLLVLGLAHMIGDLSGVTAVKAIACATVASPAPRVFCAHGGLETYSTQFFLEWKDHQGAEHSLKFTPELNQKLRGPYNRRNVYGAVIAYGPLLAANPKTRPMLESVLRYAWTGDAPLFRELGIDPDSIRGRPRIRLEPIAGSDLGNLPLVLEFPDR